MRKFFTILSVLFVSQLSLGQSLADVSITNSGRLIAIDEIGSVLFEKYLGYQERLIGYSSSIIVTQTEGGRVTVYDQSFSQISSRYIANDEKIKRVSDNYIILVNDSGRVFVLDKFLNHVTRQ